MRYGDTDKETWLGYIETENRETKRWTDGDSMT